MQTIARAVRGNKARAHRTQITLANDSEVTRTGTLKRLHGTMISIYLSIYLSEIWEQRTRRRRRTTTTKRKGQARGRTERQNLEFHALVERILLVDNLVIVVIEFLKTWEKDKHLLETWHRPAGQVLGIYPHHTRLPPHRMFPPSSSRCVPPQERELVVPCPNPNPNLRHSPWDL